MGARTATTTGAVTTSRERGSVATICCAPNWLQPRLTRPLRGAERGTHHRCTRRWCTARRREPTRAVGAAAIRDLCLLVISYKRFVKIARFVSAPTTITILAAWLPAVLVRAWGPELLRRASRECLTSRCSPRCWSRRLGTRARRSCRCLWRSPPARKARRRGRPAAWADRGRSGLGSAVPCRCSHP